jgi:hypothetical protein
MCIDEVSQKLRDILARYGESITAEPEKLEALLMDNCPNKRKEVRLLVTACRERLPGELRSQRTTPDVTLSRHYNILVDNYGFSREIAYWTVITWAYVLGVPSTFKICKRADTAKIFIPSTDEQQADGSDNFGNISQKLRDILASYGEGIVAEPEKLEAILMDCCQGRRKEIRSLIIACKDGLPVDLLKQRANADITLSRYYNMLLDNYGLSAELSYWAVMAWAYALGVTTAFEIKAFHSIPSTILPKRPLEVSPGLASTQPPEGQASDSGTTPVKQASGQPASFGQSTTIGSPAPGTVKSRKNLPVVLAGLVIIAFIVIIFMAINSLGGGTPSLQSTPQPGGNTVTTGQQYTLLTPGVLSIATEAHYPPFETINPATSAFEGFDIDLMNEIGKELGLEVKYTDHPFDTIIIAVQTKKFDAAISAFTITPKRQEIVDFTDPYFERPGELLTETEYFGIVVNKENPGLTAAINQALSRIKADGRFQKIYDKWFV